MARRHSNNRKSHMLQCRKQTVITLVCVVVPILAAADEKIAPLNGKDLSNWTTKEPTSRSHWQIGKAVLKQQDKQQIVANKGGKALINTQGRGVDIYTLQKFSDVRIELEVMVPKGSNSGIYVMGEYMHGPTPSGVTGEETPAGGPLMFQGDHGPVAFRNITIQVMKRP